MRWLVTGAAGFIGSHLTFRLLARGEEVTALVRPGSAGSGLERLEALREGFELAGAWPPPGLEVVEGDIRRESLDLGAATARALFDGLDQILHSAALVEFAADRRQAVMETNFEALGNLVPLARDGAAVLNLISTAYVCGRAGATVPEGPVGEPRPSFRNAYEESKYLAERLLVEELGPRGYRVLRPAIVIGEHTTGRTSSFNTLYVFLEMLEALHQRAERDGSELRLRVRCEEESGLNLVPVDWLAEAAIEIARSPQTEGGFFHLTNPAPVRLRALGDLLSEIYPLLQLTGVPEAEFAARPPDARERTVDRGLALYRGYLEDHPRFEVANTLSALGSSGPNCPPMDREWLVKLIEYARRVGWGRVARKQAEGDPDGSVAYCRSFFDAHLAGRTGETLLAKAPQVDAHFEVRLTDSPDFYRHVELRAGKVERVGPAESAPQWSYEMSSGVLRRIASARLDPREAFFSRQAEIRGDMEAGLRFANLIVEFFRESPFEVD